MPTPSSPPELCILWLAKWFCIPLPDGPMTLDAILGFPVIKELGMLTLYLENFVRGRLNRAVKELGMLTLYPDKIELRRADEKSKVSPNLAIDLLKPILFMRFEGEEMPFTFDSGAGTSVLTEVSYEKYKDWVDRNGQEKAEQSGGAGGTKTMQVIVLPSINFQSNGQALSIPHISVSKEVVSTSDGVYFGNIGQDLIKQYSSWTINFKESWIRFNQ